MKQIINAGLSRESFDCRNVIPSQACVSSRDFGWTSLLVDVHSRLTWHNSYAGVITPDPRIGVSLSGHYITHYHSKGVGRNDVFKPGTTTVLRSDETRRFRFTPLGEKDCEFALIYFPLAELALAADHFRRPGQRSAVPFYNQAVAQDRTIYQLTRAIIRAMTAGAPDLYAQSAGAFLASHVVFAGGLQSANDDERSGGQLTDGRLARVMEFMSANFGQQISLDQLADESGISKYHFTRLFQRKAGATPMRYLSQIRLEAARDLLVTTNMRIGDVASVCGFTTPSHFSTAFSARYGTSPEKFRQAHA
jgi:AraC family transcriptional regulator